MKNVVILFLLAFAKVSMSMDSTGDPSGWNSYFATESHEHIDAVDIVDPSGWNYDRDSKSSVRNSDKDKKKQVLEFCQRIVKQDLESNILIENEIEVAVKSRVAAIFNNKATEEKVPFIKRFISILLESANLHGKYLEGGPDVSGIIEIIVTTEHLKTLLHFSNSSANISMKELDSILSASIHGKPTITFGLPELIDKIFFMATQKEIWLPFVLFFIMLYVFHLIRRTRTKLLTSVVLLIFTVSFLVEYYKMYKEVEIKQKVILDKYKDLPSSCHTNENLWSSFLKAFSFNKEDKECLEYHKALQLDPLVEVSPSRVLSNILVDFILNPFSKAGEAIAAFTSAILGGLPFHCGWIVWLISYVGFFVMMIIAFVLFIGGSMQFRGLFSGVNISRNGASPIAPGLAPASPGDTGVTLPTSRSQPLLEAVSGMSNFVLMDANSLGTLVLRAQSSVTALHSGVEELVLPPDKLLSRPSNEKIDLSELQKERLHAVAGKQESKSSKGEQEILYEDVALKAEQDGELESDNVKEELLVTFEVIQSDITPLESSITETNVSEKN